MRPAASFEAAWSDLERTIDEVEDEFSGVPKNPARWQSDGRIYMPQVDSEVRPPRPWVRKFRTRGHYALFGPNGSVEVQDLKGERIHQRRGADGRGVLS